MKFIIWMRDTRYAMRDVGYWILDVRCWMVATPSPRPPSPPKGRGRKVPPLLGRDLGRGSCWLLVAGCSMLAPRLSNILSTTLSGFLRKY